MATPKHKIFFASKFGIGYYAQTIPAGGVTGPGNPTGPGGGAGGPGGAAGGGNTVIGCPTMDTELGTLDTLGITMDCGVNEPLIYP